MWGNLAGAIAEAMMVRGWHPDDAIVWTASDRYDKQSAEAVLFAAYGDVTAAAEMELREMYAVYTVFTHRREPVTALAEALHRDTTLDTEAIADLLSPWYPNLPRADADTRKVQELEWREVRAGPFPRRLVRASLTQPPPPSTP